MLLTQCTPKVPNVVGVGTSAARMRLERAGYVVGEISYVDSEVRHSGKASLRLEHFTANPHGHGRVMQTIKVQPHRCYRVTVWVKTDGLEPPNAFQMVALTARSP